MSARGGAIAAQRRVTRMPGTARAASGMPAKLRIMPASATVPSAHAVIGAAAMVAPVGTTV
jgi:hypothetical protein